MKHIEINIGKACNSKCRFCMSSQYAIKKVGETFGLVDFDLIKEEIRIYANKGYKSIGYIGGDISIHPNIYEIINESRIFGFENINIVTNGMVFGNYKRAEKIVMAGVTRINISIHSHLDKTEDYLTQVRGGLQKKLRAIDNFNVLYNEGLLKNAISMNIVLNGSNYRDILKTCLFFHKNKGIKDIRMNFLWNRFFSSKKDRNILEFSYVNFLPYLKQIIIYSLKTDLRITFDSIPACIFAELGFENSQFIINQFLGEDFDYIGEVSNINKDQIFNWKEQKINELKIKFDKCYNCLYFQKCQGVWKEYVERYGEEEFRPIN